MTDKGSEQFFWQAAERAGWALEDASVRERLEALYREYRQLCEADAYLYGQEKEPFIRICTPVDWNDEDADEEDTDGGSAELKDWTEAPQDVQEAGRRQGAAEYYAALQEVCAVAKRILRDLEETLARGKSGNAPEEQTVIEQLRLVAGLNRNHSPREAEAALAKLEESAYHCMVGKKGFLGIKNNVVQKVQELAKEGWALAGQAQVDLNLTALPEEDPKSGIDPELPLSKQMQQSMDAAQLRRNTGRLQRLVRFDDLQMDLRSQHHRQTPKN